MAVHAVVACVLAGQAGAGLGCASRGRSCAQHPVKSLCAAAGRTIAMARKAPGEAVYAKLLYGVVVIEGINKGCWDFKAQSRSYLGSGLQQRPN